jgi:N utilization substance protein B
MASEPDREEPVRQERPAAPAATGRGRGRRLGRILAFQTLYEMDVSRHRPGEVLQRLLDEQHPAPEAGEFARELVTGVLRHRAAIDELIHSSAPAYPLAQMSPVDRNILRIGIYECLYTSQQVPARVAVNEAVELAKRYGGESTPRFVNGVLGHLIRREQEPTAPEAQDAP